MTIASVRITRVATDPAPN